MSSKRPPPPVNKANKASKKEKNILTSQADHIHPYNSPSRTTRVPLTPRPNSKGFYDLRVRRYEDLLQYARTDAIHCLLLKPDPGAYATSMTRTCYTLRVKLELINIFRYLQKHLTKPLVKDATQIRTTVSYRNFGYNIGMKIPHSTLQRILQNEAKTRALADQLPVDAKYMYSKTVLGKFSYVRKIEVGCTHLYALNTKTRHPVMHACKQNDQASKQLEARALSSSHPLSQASMSRDNCSVVPERLELLTPSPASPSVVSGHSHAYPSEDTIVEFSQIPCTNDDIQSIGDSSHNDSLRVQPQVYGWNQREFLVPETDEITVALIPHASEHYAQGMCGLVVRFVLSIARFTNMLLILLAIVMYHSLDPQFKEHLPSLWSIDVNHRASYTHHPAAKRYIAAYSFSQDGHHIVICAQHINESAALDKVIDLELWVLKDETGKIVQTSPFLRTSERLQLKSNFKPSVSVSANGSQISCLDSTTTLRRQRMSADSSAHYPVYALARRSESSTELVLHPSTKACRRFQHYRGEGRFQCAEPGVNDHKPQSGPQYFVTYNKTSLDVYNTDEGWKHLHRLDMQSVGFNPRNSDNITLSKNLRSRYFVATRNAGYGQRGLILVWDYEQGLLVSFDETPGVTSQICISDAALMMALFENEHVHLYRTRTLTLLGSVHVPQAKGAVGRLHFISKDRGILLVFVHPEGSPLIGGGFVLDIATLSIVKKISFTGTGSISPLEISIDCIQNGIPVYHQLTSVSAIPLSASMHLKLTTVSGMCDSRCPQSSQARSPLYKEVHSDSGLHFKMTKDNNRITVVASDDSGQHKQMTISSPRIKDESGIFGSGSHFAVYLGNLCIIWALPVAMTDTFELVSVRYPEDLIICHHGRPQLSTRFFAPVQQYEHYINKQHAAAPFQKEIPSLYVEQNGCLQVRLSDLLGCNLDGLDNSTRSTIFRYIRGFLKDYNGVKSAWDKIVGADTSNPLATVEAYHLLEGLSELLTSTSDCIWIPQTNMKISDNPLVKFFQASNHLPELTRIITVVMEYYLQQARIHKDPCFVQLVTQALSFIMRAEGSNHVAVSRILHEVSMRTLREAAFIPVRDHLFVFKHHVLARSLSSYFPDVFCDNEEKVMHLVVKEEKERKASTQESVDQETSDLEKTDSEGRVRGDIHEAARKDLDCIESSRFKYDVFVAPMDLLWGPYKNDGIIDDPYEKESHCSSRLAIFHSYRRAFFPLLWLKLMPNAKPFIKCHDWDHQTFDNPAIAALVEYKWNSFGFYYWLLVFCCKASLYLMILTVVFIQTDNLQVDLTWLLISTMGVAAVLLWFEIVQFLKKGLAYTLPEGFRWRNREWFQDSIYYTATPKTVREYNAKTLRLRDEVVIESSPAFDMHRFPAGISDRDPSVEEGGGGGRGVCGSHDIETRKEIEALRNQVNSQQQVMNDFSAAFHKNAVEVSKQMEEMMGLLKKLSERNG
ncbi:hypothetical protein K457DRAFT_156392 [Linnemannia elongata AG-77]|uniref:Uncharacterized protein n=1 Tax=Linnemannia elongata AG-77 TaxID=1314771 RepID=A0A197JVA4_9FUNG|nr:hypothetical protein K457DRAFT_156392 [Linnemannia elongata AG-77]